MVVSNGHKTKQPRSDSVVSAGLTPSTGKQRRPYCFMAMQYFPASGTGNMKNTERE